MNQQEKIDLIVKLKEAGKTWWEISESFKTPYTSPDYISPEMCRYRYNKAKGLLKIKNSGMDLRDYFAAKAMQAIMTNNTLLQDAAEFKDDNSEISIAEYAYAHADAMMEARKK